MVRVRLAAGSARASVHAGRPKHTKTAAGVLLRSALVKNSRVKKIQVKYAASPGATNEALHCFIRISSRAKMLFLSRNLNCVAIALGW